MPRISFCQLAFGLSAAALLAAAAGCGDPFGHKASFSNVVDTITLYALRNTPIRLPSAYSMLDQVTVRTDLSSSFDFAFDLSAQGRALIYPAGALGLSRDPGIQLSDKLFEELRSAPSDGYVTDSSRTVVEGSVFLARSRVSSAPPCIFVSVPRYGKFHVLAIDTTARSIRLEALVDGNCGFHGLEPGIPGS
jgi:hypothetical protein